MMKYATYLLYPILFICLFTMAGWISDIEFLKRPFSELVAMNPVTAAGMMLISAALYLYFRKTGDRLNIVAGYACAIIVLAIGGGKMMTVAGIDIGIDGSLFRGEILAENAAGQVNRMAINSAFAFMLCGVVLLLVRSTRQSLQLVVDYITLLIFIIGLFSFIGYIYRIREYYYLMSHTPMAIQTALCFLFVALALLTYHSDRGFMRVITSDYIGGKIGLRLTPVVILVPIIFGYSSLYILSWVLSYSVELGMAALTTSIVTAFLIVLWYVAHMLNRTDQVRRASEQQLRQQALLLPMLPNGVIYLSVKRNFIQVNEAARAMFDLGDEDLAGKSFDHYLDLSSVRNPPLEEVTKAVHDTGYWIGETQISNRRTGKIVTVICHLQGVDDIHNNEPGYIIVYTDITDRRATEERLELAIEASAGALWDWDIVTGVKWFSPKHYELLGYKYGTINLTIEMLREALHSDDSLALFHQIEMALAGKVERVYQEVRAQTGGGNYKWIQMIGKVKFDNEGRPVRLIGASVDIDEKKKIQEMVRMQADLFKLMPDAVVYTARDLSITSMNVAAEHLFEITEADALGRKIDDITTIEMVGDTSRQEARAELWGEKGSWRGECLLTMPSGARFNFLTALQTIKDDVGVPVGLVCIYTDVTPMRVNEQLKKSLLKEEDNNKYLRQLTYISTHDLKAPIVAASELINVLVKSKAIKEGYEEVLEMTRYTVDQMKRTNQALNDILKIRTNLGAKNEMSGGLMPLDTIIADVKDTVYKSIGEKNGALSTEVNGVGHTLFPYLHTKSILYNLISNSIKYADPDRALIISLSACQSKDRGIILIIQDNGLGIDLAKHGDKLFGAFKRFHNHVEGSGVGLHIVKSLIDQYEGEIKVKSAVGQGTSFEIIFKNAIIESWN